jgi:predicted alpha/beta-hydrolase family hydrolase
MAGDFRLPLFAGGKSFGARMTSQTQADTPLPDVLGLLFLGFPLHAAKQPSVQRADHLHDVHVPMLFLQGTRDALADTALLLPVVEAAGATLNLVEAADHSFHVPKRSRRSDADVLDDILDVAASWMRQVLARPEIFGQAQ